MHSVKIITLSFHFHKCIKKEINIPERILKKIKIPHLDYSSQDTISNPPVPGKNGGDAIINLSSYLYLLANP